MPLPTLEKTWTYQVNQYILAQSTVALTNREIYYTIKQSFISNGNWSVIRSSDGFTVSNSDLWTGAAACNTYAWVALRNTTPSLGGTFDLYLCVNSSGNLGYNIIPRGLNLDGGANGISTPPTSINALDCLYGSGQVSGIKDFAGISNNSNAVIHCIQSSDGQCIRIFICTNNALNTIFYIDTAKTSLDTSVWNIPFITGFLYSSTTLYLQDIRGYSSSSASNFYKTRLISGSINPIPTIPSSCAITTQDNATRGFNSFTAGSANEAMIFPIKLVHNYHSSIFNDPSSAQLGSIYDFWIGPSYSPPGIFPSATSITEPYFGNLPSNGIKSFAHFASIIVPWNGSYILTS